MNSYETSVKQKIDQVIYESTTTLDRKQIEAYKNLTNQLADYLIKRYPSSSFTAVLDGLTGSGKSTFSAYLLANLNESGRLVPNWLELDCFLESPEKRAVLLRKIHTDYKAGKPFPKNQHINNYKYNEVPKFFQELEEKISKNESSKVTEFSTISLDKYSGEIIKVPFIHGRDNLVENEYSVHFSEPIRKLEPIYIRIKTNDDEAEKNFINRTKIKYGSKEDTSDNSHFMQMRESLFHADLETYKDLAKKTDHLIDIVVDMSEKPNKWRIYFLK